jgi:hypothetical protein
MDERESPSPARLLAELGMPMILGVIGVAVYALMRGGSSLADFIYHAVIGVSALCLFIGAYVVWSVLRYINRRDDPRHAKRPPDPP